MESEGVWGWLLETPVFSLNPSNSNDCLLKTLADEGIICQKYTAQCALLYCLPHFLPLSLTSVALASLGKKKKVDLIYACNWLRVQSKINGNKIFFVVIVVALKKIIFLQSCCAGIPATPGLWEIVRALPLPRSTPLSHVKVRPDQPPISHFFLMRQAL